MPAPSPKNDQPADEDEPFVPMSIIDLVNMVCDEYSDMHGIPRPKRELDDDAKPLH